MKVHERVTRLILERLKEGTVPWHQPWSVDRWPRSLITQKRYRGINVFMLNLAEYSSPYWLTFKQAKSLGGSIKRDEKGYPLTFWKIIEKKNSEGEIRQIPLLRYYTVFNLRQCDGITSPVELPGFSNQEPMDACENILTQMPKKPEISYDESRASYCPEQDKIIMPGKRFFESIEEFYCTLFHELIHSTGHTSRLNRKTVMEPASRSYADFSKEELIAELGAAFLCGHAGIENVIIDNSAAYIAGWIDQLEKDKKLINNAAAQAQKAFDYIIDDLPVS